MAKNMTTEQRIEMVNRFVSEKPSDVNKWIAKNAYASSGLVNAVQGYADKHKISPKSAIDALKMGFISLEEIQVYWRVIGEKCVLMQKIDELESRIDALERGLGL